MMNNDADGNNAHDDHLAQHDVHATEHCSIEALCPMKGNWNKVNDAIRKTLFNLTLADLIITVQPDISEARPNLYTTQSHKN